MSHIFSLATFLINKQDVLTFGLLTCQAHMLWTGYKGKYFINLEIYKSGPSHRPEIQGISTI